jgi:choline dehydrogenase-like flavoprotein
MTAALAAEAGKNVLLVEEGSNYRIDSAPSFSLAEMDQKYRNGGLNVTFGKTNITYLEGRCVGGGSEINAALYHRPLASTIAGWRDEFRVNNLDPDQLWPHFEAVERECSVNTFPGGPGPAADVLRDGAGKMGWSTREIARFWAYDKGNEGPFRGRRQSMTETLVPRALSAGARLLSDSRVVRLVRKGNQVSHAVGSTTNAQTGQQSAFTIRFKQVFVCAGAVQSPLLLRRSGFTNHVGDSLRLHPMIRVTARFKQPFNDPSFGVPVEQVDQFKPELTLGCSYSSVPHLALWMGESADKRARLKNWQHTGIFYVAAVGTGVGTIRELPVLNEPFVRLPLTSDDLVRLGEGLRKLGQLLFAAGATEITSPVSGGRPITDQSALEALCRALPQGRMAVSTIHLFSSIPMGEDESRCPVDSFGKVRETNNLWVNDASLFPKSPAVNPQGTVLAVARRNVLRFLDAS